MTERQNSDLSGAIHALFAFDIGFQVDIDRAATLTRDGSRCNIVRSRRPAPAWFDFSHPPLRLVLQGESVTVGRSDSAPEVEALVYDFGAVLLTYRFPLPTKVERLSTASDALRDHPALEADAQGRVRALAETIRDATAKPQIAETFEDYIVFAITDWGSDLSADAFLRRHAGPIACAIEGSSEELAEEQASRSLEGHLSYTPFDMAIVDWNASILLDSEPDDLLTVLQHVNVELLQLRVLDNELDNILDHADETLGEILKTRVWPAFSSSRLLGRFSSVQTDAAVAFEGAHNAIKLFGNQYLARVFRLAAERLNLDAWQQSVQRKLAVTESLYQQMSDATSVWRLETLEWVIIALIALSMILPFVPWYGH